MNKLAKLGLLASTSYVVWSYGALAQQIPSFPNATVPFSGTEQTYLVQGGASKNMTLNQLATWAGPTTVNTTSLRNACTTSLLCPSGHPIYASGVLRLTDGVAGAPPLPMAVGSGVCAIDDGAVCVDSADGNQWDGQFYGPADVREWGCIGNGSTDVTVCLQTARNAGIPLLIPNQQFLISSTLTSPSTASIEYITGLMGGLPPSSLGVCPTNQSTILVNSDINAFNFSGTSFRLENLCIQMAPTPLTRTSGAAVLFGGTSSSHQGGDIIYDVAVFNTYDGFLAGYQVSGTTGTTQTNGVRLVDDLIVYGGHTYIGIGGTSSGASTVGLSIRNVELTCPSLACTAATGIAVYDGAGDISEGDQGPYGMGVGTLIQPGSGQNIIIAQAGVVGDTNATHNLIINSTGGIVKSYRAINAWFSGVAPILIEDAGGINDINDIKISASTLVGRSTSTSPFVQTQNDVAGLHFEDNTLNPFGGTGQVGLNLNSTGVGATIVGNQIINDGKLSFFLQLSTPPAGTLVLVANDMRNVATAGIPISGTLSTGNFAVISHNAGLDDQIVTVASSAAISLPFTPRVIVSGSTSITSIANLWKGRDPFTLLPPTSGAALPSLNVGCTTIPTPASGTAYIGIYDWAANCIRWK